ncbi:MAG TPA: hypothetical protein PK953_08800, partial [Smithellaceae bacterium]|nr:hypothetical protein [Smithellaceae bacterium]
HRQKSGKAQIPRLYQGMTPSKAPMQRCASSVVVAAYNLKVTGIQGTPRPSGFVRFASGHVAKSSILVFY